MKLIKILYLCFRPLIVRISSVTRDFATMITDPDSCIYGTVYSCEVRAQDIKGSAGASSPADPSLCQKLLSALPVNILVVLIEEGCHLTPETYGIGTECSVRIAYEDLLIL